MKMYSILGQLKLIWEDYRVLVYLLCFFSGDVTVVYSCHSNGKEHVFLVFPEDIHV